MLMKLKQSLSMNYTSSSAANCAKMA